MNKKLKAEIEKKMFAPRYMLFPLHTELNERVLVKPLWDSVFCITVKHFKGGNYEILGLGIEKNSLEIGILYVEKNGGTTIYFRPYNMFLEECSKEQKEKYKQDFRFELIEE